MPTTLLSGEIRTYVRCEAEPNMYMLATPATLASCPCAASASLAAPKTIFGLYTAGVICAASVSGSMSFMWGLTGDAVRCVCSMAMTPRTINAISGVVLAAARVTGAFTVTGLVNNIVATCYCAASVAGSLRKLSGYVISSGRTGSISDSRRVR